MTSVEIAELTGKSHRNVMRDIRKLIDQGAICESNFGLSSYAAPMPNGGFQQLPMFKLDYPASMTLVTGYDAVMDNSRRCANHPQDRPIRPSQISPQAEALSLPLDAVDRAERLELKIEHDQPLVDRPLAHLIVRPV